MSDDATRQIQKQIDSELDEAKTKSDWKGPENTVERLWWVHLGMPPEKEWLKVKWDAEKKVAKLKK